VRAVVRLRPLLPSGTEQTDGCNEDVGSNVDKKLVHVGGYPLVICYSLLLNMAIEIVSFPINIMVL
jgi:hypothetical protein